VQSNSPMSVCAVLNVINFSAMLSPNNVNIVNFNYFAKTYIFFCSI